MKTNRRILAMVFAAALAVAPAWGQGDLVQSGLGSSGVVLDPGFGGARVEVAGQWIEPELPAGALVTRIWHLGGGWLASGSVSADGGHDLLLLLGRGASEPQVLETPRSSGAPLRGGAVPFIADGEMVGLAWLEGQGPTSMSVRATTHQEGEWGTTEVVSMPGPGSQVSLSGTVLADESWLLVWTAYDGEDDDVFFSRRVNGVWSRPRRVHADNDTPDIVPRLHAVGNGALAAWSRLDGFDYRLRIAAFQGGRWRVVDYVGGEGSLFPEFFASGDGTYVLYQNVDPASWHVLELDASGRIWRRAVAAEESRERPVIDAIGSSKVTLRWPSRERRTASAPQATAGAESVTSRADRTVDVDWQVEP